VELSLGEPMAVLPRLSSYRHNRRQAVQQFMADLQQSLNQLMNRD
jgi:hypothetical protein